MPTKSRATPELRIGFLVHDVSRMRRTLFDQVMRPLGVTRSQWWLLANLSRESEGMTQTELAKVLEIGKDTVGGLVDRLEATGHVERRADKADRRANRVFMTARGKKVTEGFSALARELNVKMLRGVAAEDREHVENILFLMKENLRAALKDGEATTEKVR